MSEARCRGCKKEIVWATTSTGKNIPLDPSVTVYSVVPERGRLIAVQPTPGVLGERFLVSHFNTCPNANDFSGKNKNAVVDPQRRDFNEPKEVEPPL